MSPEATFHNGIWSLPAASKNDAAEYKCVARNNVGVEEKTTILYVQGIDRIELLAHEYSCVVTLMSFKPRCRYRATSNGSVAINFFYLNYYYIFPCL